MSSSPYRVRRATLEDLPALRELWTKLNLALPELEKRFTEVQLAEDAEGHVVGAIGIKIERLHGFIHTEAIPFITDKPLYDAFWERLQILARNYGLFRLWTESQTPYWALIGFKTPEDKVFEKRPAAVGASREKLLTLALKEENAEGLSVEQQFEIFTQAQKAETDRLMQQAQAFKKFAYALLAIACGAFIVLAIIRFMKLPQIKQMRPGR